MFTELGHAEPFQDSQGRGQKCKVAVERFDCSVGLRVGWGTLGATNPGWRQVGWHEAVPSRPPTCPPPPAQSNDTPSSQPIFSNTRLLQEVSPSSALVRMNTRSLDGLPSDSLSVTLPSALVPFLQSTKQLHDAPSMRLHWVLTVTGSLLFQHGALALQPLCLSL